MELMTENRGRNASGKPTGVPAFCEETVDKTKIKIYTKDKSDGR
jgi:hypothetical protein